MLTNDLKKMVLAAIKNCNRNQGSMPVLRALKKIHKLTPDLVKQGLIESRDDYLFIIMNIPMGFGFDMSGFYEKAEKAWEEEFKEYDTNLIKELLKEYTDGNNTLESVATFLGHFYTVWMTNYNPILKIPAILSIKEFWKKYQKRILSIVEDICNSQIEEEKK